MRECYARGERCRKRRGPKKYRRRLGEIESTFWLFLRSVLREADLSERQFVRRRFDFFVFAQAVTPGEREKKAQSWTESKEKSKVKREEVRRTRWAGRWTRSRWLLEKKVVKMAGCWHRRGREKRGKKTDWGEDWNAACTGASGLAVHSSLCSAGHSLQALRGAPSGACRVESKPVFHSVSGNTMMGGRKRDGAKRVENGGG